MNIICYARANVAVPIAAIQQEVRQLADTGWKAHLNARDYQGEWTVLPLRSPGGSVGNIAPELMGMGGGFEDTALMAFCPSIKLLLNKLDCEILSARLLNLKKGSVIKPHRDRELSFEQGEARLHFPIFTNPDVAFFVADDKIDMLPGDCWYINANLMHSVTNHGHTDRIHLVVDCKVNDWLSNLLNNAEKKTIDQPVDTTNWDKIILGLREMGTPAALATADDMEKQLKEILSK